MGERRSNRDWALVPDESRGRILAVRSARGAWRLPGRAWRVADLPRALRTFKTRHGIVSPFLRVGGIAGDVPAGGADLLLVFDALAARHAGAIRSEWVDLNNVEPSQLAPAGLEQRVDAIFAEWRSGVVPQNRPEWAKSGWFDEASSWMFDALDRAGYRASSDVRQLRNWPLSAILQTDTRRGGACLKAVFPLFQHEPAVTAALAHDPSAHVPDVIAANPERGWLLMQQFRERPLGAEAPSRWTDGLRAIAGVHRAWIARSGEAVALGVPRRDLQSLASEIPSLVADDTLIAGLSEDEREALSALAPSLREACQELDALGIPSTLIHGDFHPWNVSLDGDRLLIFDWSDAAVTHPFLDLVTFTMRTDDRRARVAMREAYLAAWADVSDTEQLRRGVALAEPIGALYQVMSYREILARMAGDDRFFLEQAPTLFLRRALASWEDVDTRKR